jgi:hypothetical protein
VSVPETLVVKGEVNGRELLSFTVKNFPQYLAARGVKGAASRG